MAGPGFGAIAGVDNYKAEVGNGLGPKTTIVAIVGEDTASDVSQVELDATLAAMALTHTVAGVAGTVADGTMHVALQGTAAVGVVEDDYADGVTATVVATFTD